MLFLDRRVKKSLSISHQHKRGSIKTFFNNIIVSNNIACSDREWQNSKSVLNIDGGGQQRRDKK